MHRKLTETAIEATCRELLASDPAVSGRTLRAELRHRFGSSGRTARVFAVWRRLRPNNSADAHRLVEAEREIRVLTTRCAEADAARAAALERAELAELRERAHQARWAREIDALREAVTRLSGEGRRAAELESRLLDLQRAHAVLQRRLAVEESPAPLPMADR